jgi:hypothetical protein
VLSYDLERARQRVLGIPAAVAWLEHAQAALSSEVQGLRELMASLRPPTLDEVGLEAALRDQVGAFTRHSGVDCSVRVALAGRLDSELKTIVYRVAQEALLNVTRQARATRLWLELEGVGDQVRLCIPDDGSASTPWPGRAGPRRPLRPGRHARAGRDGRRPLPARHPPRRRRGRPGDVPRLPGGLAAGAAGCTNRRRGRPGLDGM